jgi:hypothetical protein
MSDMLDVAIYVIGPIGVQIAVYGFWLSNKVDKAEARRMTASHDIAHHPAE